MGMGPQERAALNAIVVGTGVASLVLIALSLWGGYELASYFINQ